MDLVPTEAQLFLPGLEGLPVRPRGMPLCEWGESSCLHYLGELSLQVSLSLKSFAA